MKQYFSRELWWQGFKKIRVPGIAMSITVIIINLLFPVLTAGTDISRLEYATTTPSVAIVNAFSEFAPLHLATVFFAPLLAFVMFSYLNDRGKSDFYHSIPQTRICVFISLCASIATWLVGVLLLSTALNLLLWQLAPLHTVVLGEALYFMLCTLICALFTMTVAALAMTLTGTLVSNLFVALLLLLFVRIVNFVVVEYLWDLIPAYDFERSWISILSFEKYLPYALSLVVLSSARYHPLLNGEGASILIYTFCVTLALFALAAYLYHIRRSEMANKSAPNRYLQMVYRCAVTFPLLLFCVMEIIWNGFDELQLIWIVISLVIYLLYELATTKRIKTMLRSIPMFFALFGVCALVIGGMYLGKGIVALDVPDEDRVKSISISTSSRVDTYYPNGLPLDNEEAIDLVIEALEYTAPLTREQHNHAVLEYDDKYDSYLGYSPEVKTRYTYQDVTIRLKSGRVMYRRVWFEEQNYERLKELYLASEAYRQAYLKLPDTRSIIMLNIQGDYMYDVGYDEGLALYEAFRREYESLPSERKLAYMQEYGNYRYGSDLPSLYIYGFNYGVYFNENFAVVPSYFPKTFAQVMTACKEASGTFLQEKELPLLFSLIKDTTYEKAKQLTPDMYFSVALRPIIKGKDGYFSPEYQEIVATMDSDKSYGMLQNTLSAININDSWYDYSAPDRSLYLLIIDYYGLEPLADLHGVDPATQDKMSIYGTHLGLYVMLTPEEAEEIITAIKYPPSSK